MIAGIMASQRPVVVAPPPVFPEVKNSNIAATAGQELSLPISYTAAAGDMVLLYVGERGGSDVPGLSSAGWVLVDSLAIAAPLRTYLFSKVCTAAETGVTVSKLSATNMSAAIVVVQSGTFHGDVVATSNTSTSGHPNPPSLTPPWGAAKALWIAAHSRASGSSTSAYPLPGDQLSVRSATTTSGVGSAICTALQEVDSLDPGAFTTSTTGTHIAWTVAIRPSP
jgi:hypothetical protein